MASCRDYTTATPAGVAGRVQIISNAMGRGRGQWRTVHALILWRPHEVHPKPQDPAGGTSRRRLRPATGQA